METFKLTLCFATMCLFISFAALCQFENGVSGKLIDENGKGIPGVNILLKGTVIGTMTDADGKFSFDTVPSPTLVISQTGYTTGEFDLTASDDFASDNVNLMLSESGIKSRYWCCTSHSPHATHCNKNRSVLRQKDHDQNEIYKIKNPRN